MVNRVWRWILSLLRLAPTAQAYINGPTVMQIAWLSKTGRTPDRRVKRWIEQAHGRPVRIYGIVCDFTPGSIIKLIVSNYPSVAYVDIDLWHKEVMSTVAAGHVIYGFKPIKGNWVIWHSQDHQYHDWWHSKKGRLPKEEPRGVPEATMRAAVDQGTIIYPFEMLGPLHRGS